MGSIIVLILLFFVIYPIVWGVKGIKRVNSGNKEITPKWLLRLPVILLIFGLISSLFGIMIEPEIPKDDLARYLDNRGIWGGIANEALDYFSPAQIDYINKVNICNKLGWLSLVITPILFIVQALGLFKNMFGRVYIQGAAILTTLLTLITFFSFTSAMDAMMNNTATMRAISIIAPNSSSFDIQGLLMGLLYFGFMHFAFHKCLNKVYGVLTRENYKDYMQSPFDKNTFKPLDSSNTKECPHCGGTIQVVAKKCIHCGQWLEENNEPDKTEHDIVEEKKITFNIFFNKKYIIPFVIVLISILGLCWFSQNQIYGDSTIDETSVASLNQVERKEYDNLFDTGNANYILCSQEELYSSHVTKELNYDLDKDGKSEKIIIGLDQIGIKINGYIGGYGISLLTHLVQNGGLLGAYDTDDELNKGYFAQASHIDLDNDGVDEVIIALGNKLDEMAIAIYKVNSTFEFVGIIQGQSKIHIDDRKNIIVPYGSQGLYAVYVYDGNKILEITNL